MGQYGGVVVISFYALTFSVKKIITQSTNHKFLSFPLPISMHNPAHNGFHHIISRGSGVHRLHQTHNRAITTTVRQHNHTKSKTTQSHTHSKTTQLNTLKDKHSKTTQSNTQFNNTVTHTARQHSHTHQ